MKQRGGFTVTTYAETGSQKTKRKLEQPTRVVSAEDMESGARQRRNRKTRNTSTVFGLLILSTTADTKEKKLKIAAGKQHWLSGPD
jgi:hypothetical protein